MNPAPTVSDDHSPVSFQRQIAKCSCLRGSSFAKPPSGGQEVTGRGTRYLRDLQKQAYNWQRASGVKRSWDSAFKIGDEVDEESTVHDDQVAAEFVDPQSRGSSASQGSEFTCNIWTSPFTLPSTVIKDPHKEQRNWSSSAIHVYDVTQADTGNSLASPDLGMVPHSSTDGHDDREA
ncbi:unnamed protein product [Aspergillus oryzae]|nr:unnamed protein product [Aspergillus oryzae]